MSRVTKLEAATVSPIVAAAALGILIHYASGIQNENEVLRQELRARETNSTSTSATTTNRTGTTAEGDTVAEPSALPAFKDLARAMATKEVSEKELSAKRRVVLEDRLAEAQREAAAILSLGEAVASVIQAAQSQAASAERLAAIWGTHDASAFFDQEFLENGINALEQGAGLLRRSEILSDTLAQLAAESKEAGIALLKLKDMSDRARVLLADARVIESEYVPRLLPELRHELSRRTSIYWVRATEVRLRDGRTFKTGVLLRNDSWREGDYVRVFLSNTPSSPYNWRIINCRTGKIEHGQRKY